MKKFSDFQKKIFLLKAKFEALDVDFEEEDGAFQFRFIDEAQEKATIDVFKEVATGTVGYDDQGYDIDWNDKPVYTVFLRKRCVIDKSIGHYMVTADNERYFFVGARMCDLLENLYKRLDYQVVREDLRVVV